MPGLRKSEKTGMIFPKEGIGLWIIATVPCAPGEVLVSLMRQYTPMGGLPAPLNRRVSDEEYDAVLSWMYLNRLEGFTQEKDSADSGFIPDFSLYNS